MKNSFENDTCSTLHTMFVNFYNFVNSCSYTTARTAAFYSFQTKIITFFLLKLSTMEIGTKLAH